MRIIFVLPGISERPIGGFAVVYEHASRLQARGHQVSVIHSRRWLGRESFAWRALSDLHARIRRPSPDIGWYALHPGVHVRVERTLAPQNVPDADAVIATSWQTAQYVHDYPSRKGRKYYLIQHFESWSGVRDAVEATWRLPLRKIVVSKWLAEIAARFGQSSMTAYVPNGIDLESFRVDIAPEARDPLTVLWSYHPAKWKGPADGMQALEIARASSSVTACAFGVYPRPRSLPGWIEYRQSPSKIELVALYNAASIFAHSSLSEGFGLPPAEAMACGCAVAASDSAGVRDFAIDGVTAILSAPANPESLARSIVELATNQARRLRIAEAGRRHVQQFTWDAASRRLELVLRADSEPNRAQGNDCASSDQQDRSDQDNEPEGDVARDVE